ncbi:hypothetical protein ART_0015 [Arthrobacter sp. PAMC 25486]|nr:hypothetical protein ART_0015 [Arthrobacter sp. PAMC 25486]
MAVVGPKTDQKRLETVVHVLLSTPNNCHTDFQGTPQCAERCLDATPRTRP